jgi:hypothetical protein
MVTMIETDSDAYIALTRGRDYRIKFVSKSCSGFLNEDMLAVLDHRQRNLSKRIVRRCDDDDIDVVAYGDTIPVSIRSATRVSRG